MTGKFKAWQDRQGNKNFEKKYILSLIRLNNEEWLFAGIYRSYGCIPHKEGRRSWFQYKTKLLDEGSDLIGKVIVGFKRTFRQSYCCLQNYIEEFDVLEVRRTEYNIPFPGYDKVRVTWEQLNTIIDTEEWKKPLSNRKGVYLITDASNGKMYVGSATGKSKLWSRWRSYVITGHGGNEGLKKLRKKHIKENFQYSILETFTLSTDDTEIRKREQWWKEVLKSREFGYNEN